MNINFYKKYQIRHYREKRQNKLEKIAHYGTRKGSKEHLNVHVHKILKKN